MNRKNRKFIIIGSVVAVIILGVLVSIFGNVGVRRNILGEEGLSVTGPLVPGVPFTASWVVLQGVEDKSVLLKVRTANGDEELSAARYANGSIKATLPCSVAPGNGTVILAELLSGRVVGQTVVAVLPQAQDCAQ